MRRQLAPLWIAALTLAAGCGSSSPGCADGGSCGDDRPRLWGLSRGMNNYQIASTVGVDDGCMARPAMRSDVPLPVNYDETTTVVSVGAMEGTPPQPAFGSGSVAGNTATLLRENDSTDASGCTWHEKDSSKFALFDHDRFSLAVTEERSAFGAACSAPGGSCTSTWTWSVTRAQ
jgi:hypothetical protein